MRYRQEVVAYIIRRSSSVTYEQLVNEVNSKFNEGFTKQKMKSFLGNRKIRIGVKQKHICKLWTDEMQEIVFKNYKGTPYKDMIKLIKDRTGVELNNNQIKSFYGRNKLDSGLTGHIPKGATPINKGKKWDEYMSKEKQEIAKKTWFKKGQTASNKMPIGTISKTKDGYMIIKVCEDPYRWKAWTLLSRYNWEKEFGSIPKGSILCYKDGDKSNCNIDNLVLLTRKEHQVMNKKRYRSSDPELTEAGIAAARLLVKMYELKNKKKKVKK